MSKARKPSLEITDALVERLHRRAAGLFPGTRVESVEYVGHGSRTTPVMVTMADGGGLVVKPFERLGRLVPAVVGLRHLAAKGVPAPRLLGMDLGARFRRAFGRYFVFEELIPGRRLGDLYSPAERCALAGQGLALLHREKRRRCGGLLLGRGGEYIDRDLKRVLGRLRGVRHGLSEPLRKRLNDELLDRASRVGRQRGNELLHGDFNTGNLLTDRSTIWYVDLGEAHYGHFCRDLNRAFERLVQREELATASDLLDAYFDAAVGCTREEWERSRHYFSLTEAVELLVRASRRRRRAATDEDRQRIGKRLTLCVAGLEAIIDDGSE